MSSIGVRQFAAAFAKRLGRGFLAFGLCSLCLASDCPQGLSAQEKIFRFKELDRQAESAMHSRRFSNAVDLYQQAVCLIPNSARGFYGLGMAQAAAGSFLQARLSFKTADRLQPTTPMPLVMQVRVNFSLHDIEALKANLREAAARFPRDGAAHAVLARFLAGKNLLLLALAEALRSERAAGSDPASKVELAVLENTAGAYQDAIDNALIVEQDHGLINEIRASAAGVAGLSYESLGQPDRAIQYLKDSIDLDPSRDNSYLALADLYEQLERYPEAVDLLKRARTKFPDSIAVLLPLGVDLVRTEKYEEGAQILRNVIKQSPDADQAYLSLADAAHKMGNPAGELEALQALAERRPNYPMIHVLIARALLNREPVNYAKVFDELSLAEKSAPGDPDVFYLQGKAYFARGRYREAVTSLRRSIALRPTDPGPYYQLARAYQKLGDAALAHEQFERVRYLERNVPAKP